MSMPADLLKVKKRPFLFKLLSLILLSMALFGWLRFGQSIYQWQYLLELQIKPAPLYILLSGLLIGTSMTIGLIAFWFHLSWAQRFVQISVAAVTTLWWLDYLLLTRNQAAFINWAFRLLASLVVLGFIYGYLHLYNTPIRKGQDEKSD